MGEAHGAAAGHQSAEDPERIYYLIWLRANIR
jgi:hypothetical protein